MMLGTMPIPILSTTVLSGHNDEGLKCKPSTNCACVVPLIDGLGY